MSDEVAPDGVTADGVATGRADAGGVASAEFDPIDEQRRQWEARGLPHSALMTATTALIRARQLVLGRVDDALEPTGLSYARLEALAVLHFSRTGQLPLGKIGERLMVHPTSVTQVIDGLEKSGYVLRVPHPNDRRAVLATITEQGRAAVEAGMQAVIDIRFGLEELEPGEAEQLIGLLQTLRIRSGDYGLKRRSAKS